MYCQKCGSKIKDGDVFCSSCGNTVGSVEVNEASKSSNAGLICGIIAILTLWIPIVSIPCAIVAIVKGRKSNAGVVILGVVSLLLSIIVSLIICAIVFFGFLFVSSNGGDVLDRVGDAFDKYGDKFDHGDYFKESDETLSGNDFRGSDGSILMLKDDDVYFWYKDSNMNENNYSRGTYEVYNGFKAVSYVIKHLTDFNVPYTSSDSFDGEDYDINEFYILVLNCDKNIVDGKESDKESSTYYGFYDDGSLKLVNVKDKKEVNFIVSDKVNKNTL